MTVTVPVPMTSEEQAALQVEAEAQGVPVDSLLHQAVLQIISRPHGVKPRRNLSPEEFKRAWEEIADLIPSGIPEIPLEALSRENIYSSEDEW